MHGIDNDKCIDYTLPAPYAIISKEMKGVR